MHSYGHTKDNRTFYVACEHCAHVEDGGAIEGPRRRTAEEAGKAFNEAMKKFSRSFQEGNAGEY